ncbi:hypothetical protein FA15DRAFT_705606 [Coprinopsis marcescibilis]|uniref:Uncharacterized protein n=1 Tax=Coprinopsis marcescibilis TaxID=230819 RepID=A0A5C3KSQ8_COPMA|nr:hypothetical protein FA15DRAFT_705606 [Coprinopsis marcescibilis]
MTLKFEGLKVEIDKQEVSNQSENTKASWFAFLSPTPILNQFRRLYDGALRYLEPLVRPIARRYLVACLKVAIRVVPKITQAVSLEVLDATMTFTAIPGMKIVAKEITLAASITLNEAEQEGEVVLNEAIPVADAVNRAQGMAIWSNRLRDGFRRSLDRAWGMTQGTGKITFNIFDVEGTTRSNSQGKPFTTSFLSIPDKIQLTAGMEFNPRAGLIERHTLDVALSLGRVSAQADVMNVVLSQLKPVDSPKPPPVAQKPIIPSLNMEALRSSSFFSSPRFSSALQSALPSFTSSLFSGGPKSGPMSPFTPRTANALSPKAFKSPTSPFFRAISASIGPRRTPYLARSSKLKEENNISTLSVVKRVEMHVGAIELSVSTASPFAPYQARIQGFDATFGLAESSKSQLHRKWLGNRRPTEKHDPDTYSLDVSIGPLKAQKETNLGVFPLLYMGPIESVVVAHQWPAPLLTASPFLKGDPNSSFVGLSVAVSSIEATQRLDHLRELLESLPTKKAFPPEPRVESPTPLAPLPKPLALPRIAFDLDCGPISARLIFTSSGQELRALEARTNGVVANLVSEYHNASPATTQLYPSSTSVLPVDMHALLSVNIEPVTVHTRSTLDFFADAEELEDPSVFSAGAVQFTTNIRAVAETDGPAESAAIIDKSTISCNSHLRLDSISIELWNPDVVDSVHQFLSLVPRLPSQPSPSPIDRPPLRKPPIGIIFTASLAQCVAFVTAPDINPNDTYELSRGLSFRTEVGLELSSINQGHVRWYDDFSAENRNKLRLSNQSAIQRAITSSKAATTPLRRDPVVIQVQLQNSVVRSLVATQFAPSEPLISETLDVPQLPQDFIRVNHIQLVGSLSSSPEEEKSGNLDDCALSVDIPFVRADFKLSHVYSVLLAVQTLESLQARRSGPKSTPRPRSNLRLDVRLAIATTQIYWALPKRNIVTRIDGMRARVSPREAPEVGFGQARLFVPLPARVDRWEPTEQGRWDELLNLHEWEVSLVLEKPHQSVAITGRSASLRIPHGFVFHDLIMDASVLAKALGHITHITKAGRFWKMSSPEAEGPKHVPHISLRLAFLSLEVQDDPFEAKLGRIWQAGVEANKHRIEREEAFSAKVAAIAVAEGHVSAAGRPDQEYQFDTKHSVTIDNARQRLDDVHVLDWRMRLEKLKGFRVREEEAILYRLFGTRQPQATLSDQHEPDLVPVPERCKSYAPLLRLNLENLNLMIGGPAFPLDELSTFLHAQGNGIPEDTQYSLLIPLHIHFTLSALKVTLRDYPIPLLHILPHEAGSDKIAFTFDTDLVVAEEMGTEASVEWFECHIIDPSNALDNESPWSLSIPKTIMPVKTYASPSINVDSPFPTIIGWGVSSGPAMQDVMRVVETMTSPPQDPSPVMGFWDKMRLIMHWKLDMAFSGPVQVYIKGTRSPYEMVESGAGFVLAWEGSPRIKLGFENVQKELIQVTSEAMTFSVPDLDHIQPSTLIPSVTRTLGIPKPFKKVWARLNSGVRFGVGFLPERACGTDCSECAGAPRERKCRLFTFKPHYQVLMEKKPFVPELKSEADSYNGFRSDFVHFSFSLESALKKAAGKNRTDRDYSSLHLTPKVFAQFWSWCTLFDGALGLPIRQGDYYPPKPISPKLGRHIATLKYRISIPHLYVMHGYIDESRETWADGITSWVGVKGMVDEFHVDMHQREEETTVPGPIPGTTRTLRRKPFNAAEVVLKGLDLRTFLATFSDPLKKKAPMAAPPQRSNYRKHSGLPVTSPSSPWHDMNDFIELDWQPKEDPVLNLIPVVTCPRFSYFKRISASQDHTVTHKFGNEDSHVCLLDKEPSAPRVQILLASARAAELRRLIRKASQKSVGKFVLDQQTAEKMVSLLEDYVALLQDLEAGNSTTSDLQSYFLPSEIISTAEWAEFENVYHIHCPSIFLDAAIRDIMMQYYHCSLARKGLEYHMATRAVKFIRDQANAAGVGDRESESEETTSQSETINIATSAFRKMLGTEKPSVEIVHETKVANLETPDPLDGWEGGISLRKSHCCLLLKPQIVLRGSDAKDTCIIAASQAKLQSYAIMDKLNSDDPVSGKVMSRNYTSLSGMQAYSPTAPVALGNSSIPLEVLIDLRCETRQFERLVPQTDASFHYDKFNRLRLRNKATSAVTRTSTNESGTNPGNHLKDQTDLVRIHIPRFTVSAGTEHFEAISNVVTKLLLFSDPAHKTRLDRLETMIFAYDFRDLTSAAKAICDLQGRLRDASETQQMAIKNPKRANTEEDRISALQLKAHIFTLQEELSLLFDAIKLAQDRFDASAEQNNALLLHTSSSEISWRMLDERRNLLAKLVVQDINFHWLNRQDSSTVNHLTVGNLTAFDGSRYATWAEIISKYDEPANHPLLKKGLFCLARWTILPPVGGITIYENFELFFHPMRLQIDAKVGHRIMEYVWPARKERQSQVTAGTEASKTSPSRSSVDSPNGLQPPTQTSSSLPAPRRLVSSRSFTDLRAATTSAFLLKNRSTDSLNKPTTAGEPQAQANDSSEAAVMRTRSTQKTFVLVRIASLNLLLSISKEGSFECRDARIKTRDLEYRNQTWSFEELVNQFIPSNMGWKGWIKMAFHQPLLPVLPVAKELLSKTKWTASKNPQIHDHPLKLLHPRLLATDDDSRLHWLHNEGTKVTVGSSSTKTWKNPLRSKNDSPPVAPPLVMESSSSKEPDSSPTKRPESRNRVKSLFSKHKATPPKSKKDDVL